MRNLSSFLFLSLDGYYKGTNNDISWHVHGGDESKFSEDSLKAGNALIFGRVTYEMMVGFWTTPMAIETMPVVAEGMNKAAKYVFSNTLQQDDPKVIGWNNTKVISGDIISEMKKLKESGSNNMTILGSGSLVTQFTDAGLIDTYQFMIDPVAIGKGTTVFNGIKNKLNLKLTGTRTFKSGVVLMTYDL